LATFEDFVHSEFRRREKFFYAPAEWRQKSFHQFAVSFAPEIATP